MAVRQAFGDCMRKGVPFDLESEILIQGHQSFWVRTAGEAVRDAFNAEMDEAKRKALFDAFQKHMYDAAVAMKAGNYGVFQASTAKLKNFSLRVARKWVLQLRRSAASNRLI